MGETEGRGALAIWDIPWGESSGNGGNSVSGMLATRCHQEPKGQMKGPR